MSMTIQKCRSCKTKVIWCETITGKRMPVDAEPVADGNLRLLPRDGGFNRVVAPLALYANQIATFKDWESAVSKERYVSHFATCPDKASWRKRGK